MAQFHRNAKFYVYHDVPIEVFVDIITAGSQGGVFHDLVVRGTPYKYEGVTMEEVHAI